ncbi:ATP-dependent helicase rhp16-like [Macadamia integrifolia]|uniref:ATP-dependent helicase rhp16-like n=1 Tax=Macadamia integrifolia TaxID=60698 RepID=UPI001C52CC7D|nr:ATP-dependent helicase rhp16-like [Macadamia integrifolia]
MILLKHKILKSIALRRTKKGRAADIYNSLPQKIVQLRQDIFDIDEKNYYRSLYNISRLQFYQYVADKSVLNNFMHIIQLLTRIRQVADHPYIDIYSQAVCNLDINERTCDICLDVAEDPVVTSCQHVFCKDCFIYYSEALGEDSCPKQNKKASMKRTERSSFPSRIPLKELKPSTKMLALRDEINKMIQRDKSAKGVVLSQFTSFLELIGYFLFNSGIHYVPHVGQMTLATSNSAIETFNRGDCKIFLVSFKAGAAVLKLIKASHVFLMDPWWNPTQELQAVDLIRRIGQKEQVRVISFIIKDTIEEKILMLQEINQLVFEGNPGGSPKDMGRLTENELTYLFLL